MQAPDDYGRLWVALTGTIGTGDAKKTDYSWKRLTEAAPEHWGYTMPYRIYNQGGMPDNDTGYRGQFWLTTASRDKEKWQRVARELLNQEVEVQVTVRFYSFVPRSGGRGHRGRYARKTGYSLAPVTLVAYEN